MQALQTEDAPPPSPAQSPINPAVYYTTPEAAKVLRLSVTTLRSLRVSGEGPPFLRLSPKRIVYSGGDLLNWLDGRRRASTSEAH